MLLILVSKEDWVGNVRLLEGNDFDILESLIWNEWNLGFNFLCILIFRRLDFKNVKERVDLKGNIFYMGCEYNR